MSRLAGWTWIVGGALCPKFIPSPGGESQFPRVELCADSGLGLTWEQNVHWAKAAVTRVQQSLSPLDHLQVTVIKELNQSHGGTKANQQKAPVWLHQQEAGVPHHLESEQAQSVHSHLGVWETRAYGWPGKDTTPKADQAT